MEWALHEVRNAVRNDGISVQRAIEKYATSGGISANTLALAHRGRLGSVRKLRQRQRRRRSKP